MRIEEQLAALRAYIERELPDNTTRQALLEHLSQVESTPQSDVKRRTLSDLEYRIWDRTEGLELRTTHLTALAELSSRISTLRDPNALLQFVATTLTERFDFYYVGIFQTIHDKTGSGDLILTHVNSKQWQPASPEIIKISESGMISWAASYRKPQLVRDVRLAPTMEPQGLCPETRLRIVLPLVSADKLLGVLDLQSTNAQGYDEDSVQTLASVANQISTALENARLFVAEEQQRKVAEQQGKLAEQQRSIAEQHRKVAEQQNKIANTLRDISLVISTLTMVDQEDVLELILEQIGRVIEYEAGSIWLDDGSGSFKLAAEIGYADFCDIAQVQAVTLDPTQHPLIHQLCASTKIIVIPDVVEDVRWVHIDGFQWIRSWVGVRISVRGKAIGILTLNHRQPGFFAGSETILDSLTVQLSIAIENAQLVQAERHQREIANTLREIGLVLTSTLDQATVLQRILEQVARVIPYDAAGIWLDKGDQMLQMVAGIGYERFGLAERAKTLVFPRTQLPFIGNLSTSKRVTTIRDTHAEKGYAPEPGYEWVRSWASALIVVRGRAIGNLALDHSQPGFYGPQYEPILEVLATQLSIAIQNAQLFEAERQQRVESETLRDMALVLTSTLDQQIVLRLILEQVARLVPYDAAAIWLNDSNRIRHYVAGIGYERFGLVDSIQRLEFSPSADPVADQLDSTRKVLVIPDVAAYPGWVIYPGYEWIKSWAAAPIIIDNEVIGVLNLDHTQTNFYDLSYGPILKQLAVQISIAVKNARLYTALEDSERRTRAMLDAVPDLMFRYNRGGDYLALSAGNEDDLLMSRQDFVGENLSDVLTPDMARLMKDFINKTLSTDEMQIFEYALPDSSDTKYYEARMVVCGTDEVLCIVRNITERKRSERELQQIMEELQRSNEELQQFAYVASHDLQEPLRMIASYVQLLSRRYTGKLDADADEFINYAVDGAHRMQRLINDLLAYSRVGTQGKAFEPTDCELVLKQALANLQIALEENHAEITHTPLPTVIGDPVQLIGLFQNLIGNALKFHGEQPPRIHITAEQDLTQADNLRWLFSVRDNGIGIAPEHTDRIFVIFKRLHTATEYPGTGIGLAICKKVVERHGGRIWVESAVGQGATFHFLLPAITSDRNLG